MVLTVLCFFDNDTSKFEPTQIRQRRIWRFCAKVNNGLTVSDEQNSKFIAFRTVRRDQAPPHGRRFAPDRSLLHSKAQMSSSQIIRISYAISFSPCGYSRSGFSPQLLSGSHSKPRGFPGFSFLSSPNRFFSPLPQPASVFLWHSAHGCSYAEV